MSHLFNNWVEYDGDPPFFVDIVTGDISFERPVQVFEEPNLAHIQLPVIPQAAGSELDVRQPTPPPPPLPPPPPAQPPAQASAKPPAKTPAPKAGSAARVLPGPPPGKAPAYALAPQAPAYALAPQAPDNSVILARVTALEDKLDRLIGILERGIGGLIDYGVLSELRDLSTEVAHTGATAGANAGATTGLKSNGGKEVVQIIQKPEIILSDITVWSRSNQRLGEFQFRQTSGLQGLKNNLATCLKISPLLPVLIKMKPSGDIITDATVCLVTDNCSLEVIYCDTCAKTGESFGGDDFYFLSSCGHTLCFECLGQTLRNSKVRRDKLGSELLPEEAQVKVESLHQRVDLGPLPLPLNLAPDSPPPLVHMNCPECNGELTATDINDHPIYFTDFQEALQEIDDYINMTRSLRECCMSKLGVCDDGLEPIHRLMQLGCDHFFHKPCLAHYLKSEIDKAKMEPNEPLMCYECVGTRHDCTCLSCIDVYRKESEKRGHIITEPEVCSLVRCEDAIFSELDKDNWERVQSTITATRMPGMSLIRCNKCESSFCIDQRQELEPVITCPYVTCSYKLCTACKLEAHAPKTCAENKKEIRRRDLADLNVKCLQDCPFCETTWSAPIHCLHVKCEKLSDGCERQFCFLCAASHTPTVAHGAWYHRPQCTFYNPQCDCEPICLKDNELAVCKKSIYSPGPCQACKEARSGNKCTHSTWRPCGSCQRNSVECTHWCDECARKGSLCTPPGNPKVPGPDGELVYQFKVFPHDEVEAEARLLNGEGSSGVERK